MSDQVISSNEEFEKVDPDFSEQDENVTSSSMPGDMAEEDRYSANEQADFLGDLSSAGSVDGNKFPEIVPSGQPLIDFDNGDVESTVTGSAPPEPELTEPKKRTASAAKSEGCWVKNVDPRDESKLMSESAVAAMDEWSGSADTADMSAAATATDHPSRVLEIIYWRDVKKTGVVFGTMMFVLLSLAFCSLLSVLAYLSLAVLTVTFSFRVYKSVMQAVQKTTEGHPFKKLLDLDIELHEDVVQGAAQKIADNINNCSRELRRLYLVGDYIDSLKFGLLLWLMTYIGSWFNGMTLVILVVVSIFTLPKVYETYQGPIDQNVNLVRAQLNSIMAQVSAKIPFPKKKAKTQ